MSKWIEPSADTKYVCNDGVVMTWVSIWGKERISSSRARSSRGF